MEIMNTPLSLSTTLLTKTFHILLTNLQTLLTKWTDIDLGIGFESRKPLTTWPIIKEDFIKWMDKLQKAKEAL